MNTATVTLAIAGANVTIPAATLTALWLDKLRNGSAPFPEAREQPRIGAEWAGQGGIYAGAVGGTAGEADYALIVAESARDTISWGNAMKWAGALEVSGLRDFWLPMRKEQAILFGNAPELFAKEAYWSSEQHASDSVYAWCQHFYYGCQYYFHKSLELRARAVRRVPIWQFDPLII